MESKHELSSRCCTVSSDSCCTYNPCACLGAELGPKERSKSASHDVRIAWRAHRMALRQRVCVVCSAQRFMAAFKNFSISDACNTSITQRVSEHLDGTFHYGFKTLS